MSDPADAAPSDVPPFDVAGPIPLGTTTLIEASAGTGKTYALAALTVRLVAEHDVPIDRILIVTFTRAATAELRDRIRRRLVEAEAHLRGPRPASTVDDPVLAALDHRPGGVPCSAAEREERRARLARALTDFDTATVSTIHGFCAQVRSSMGVLSEHSIDAATAESETDLVVQVCADLYFRELAGNPRNPLGPRPLDTFIDLVKQARTLSGCHVTAASGTDHDTCTASLVREALVEVDHRLRRQGGQSFDSLLVTVRDALRADPRLTADLRRQFPVALVDEFQDTDPVQWDVFRTLFAELDTPTGAEVIAASGGPVPHSLFLVGDPKQAIYSFRGGDVYTYLDAREQAQVTALTTNQRSDPAVLTAMNALARGQFYGEREIAYHPVGVAARNRDRQAVDGRGTPLAGFQVRCLEPTGRGEIGTDTNAVRRAVAADLAVVVHQLLSSVRLDDDGEHAGPATRAVKAGDIAVLVGATSDARPVADALRQAGIPAVLRLRDDVADSDAREQWRTLLYALDRPGSVVRSAAAALTWFFGWDAAAVARAVDAAPATDDAAALVELQHQLADWSSTLTEHGIAALFGEARRTQSLVARLLRSESGERDLTDLEHLAELIHVEARARGRGLTAGSALAILDGLGGTPEDEVAADAAQRRIESDADAVQIMTIHGSKGLEFPFVLLPTLWSGGNRVNANRPWAYYDPARRGRVFDVGMKKDADGTDRRDKDWPEDEKRAKALAHAQNCGDQHRLTYVALTRAEHQTVAWWAPVTKAGVARTGLTRLLVGETASDANLPVELPKTGATDLIAERVAASGAGPCAEVVVLDPDLMATPRDLPPLPTSSTSPPSPHALRERRLDRVLDRTGRLWSFSSLARDLHVSIPLFEAGDPTLDHDDDRGVHDQPPGQDRADTGPDIAALVAADQRREREGWDRPSPYDQLGGGRAFGNLVHHLLELVDFSADPLEDALADLLAQPSGHPVTDAQRQELPGVLADVVRTPLGDAFEELRLADLAPRDRLNELGFHFSLAPDRPLSADRIGALVAEHLDPHDPLQRWAEALRSGLGGVRLQGFLNGSIDLTLRQQVGGTTRYSVLDYKTNNLAPGVDRPTLAHYRHPRLLQAMADNQYALQALLYSVALHRYLRWRVVDYDPAVHLGPVGYLFVRAMVGPETPTEQVGGEVRRAGVFTWQVPHQLVEALSDLFAHDRERPTP
jgi:exodeoxyribonuclease V beta subunit